MKTNSRLSVFALLGCVTALVLPLTAETDASQPVIVPSPRMGDTAPVGPELGRGDKRFIKKATACGAYEIAISRQAATRAARAEVRDYAATVVSTQELMNGELFTLAKRRGATIPVQAKERADVANLAKKTGGDYDEAYLDAIIDAHEDAINLLEKAAKSPDTDLAAFAVQYLSPMREHLVRAKQLEKALD